MYICINSSVAYLLVASAAQDGIKKSNEAPLRVKHCRIDPKDRSDRTKSYAKKYCSFCFSLQLLAARFLSTVYMQNILSLFDNTIVAKKKRSGGSPACSRRPLIIIWLLFLSDRRLKRGSTPPFDRVYCVFSRRRNVQNYFGM